MQITRRLWVSAPTAKVWHILAEEYANVSHWARAVTRSEPMTSDVTLPGTTVGGRVCTASIGAVTETIKEYDAAAHVLSYDAQAKSMPFFVRKLSGRWMLDSDLDKTEVRLAFDADIMPPFNLLMGWAIRRQFQTAIDETLEDLRLFAETGKVHPDKSVAPVISTGD